MRKRWKKLGAVCVATAMCAGLLAGCGSSESSSDSGKKTISIWFPAYAGTDAEVSDQEFWEEQLEPLEKEENCNFDVQILPWSNYEEKYLSGVTSGNGPDIGFMSMEMMGDYIAKDLLADMGSYFNDEEKDNYIYYDYGTIDGKQYALPFIAGNARILIGNKAILEKAGVTQMPTTWDELVSACQAIQKTSPDVKPFDMALGGAWGNVDENFLPFFWSAGGELLDEDGNVNIDTEEGREAMQFLYDLRFTHNFIDESATSNDDARIDFEAGKTGFMILATSNCLNLEGVDWDWTTALAGPDGEAKTFFAADSLVLFDKCEDKDLAMKAIKHLSSADVMSEFHKQITEQPPITKDEEYSGDERFKELYTTENDNFKTLTPFNSAVSLLTKVNENLQSMMMGEMKPEEVLKNAQDYYNENLASE